MENTQEILLELDEFNNKKDENLEITQNLENFLEIVAKTGIYIFPWSKVKKLFIKKTRNVLADLNFSTSTQTLSPSKISYANQLKSQIIERFESFNNAPFTIQRISELLLKPTNNYTQQEKYLRGLEKCLMVVTTIDPNGNKILVENGYSNGKISESEEALNKLPMTPNLNQVEIQVNKEESDKMDHEVRQNACLSEDQETIEQTEPMAHENQDTTEQAEPMAHENQDTIEQAEPMAHENQVTIEQAEPMVQENQEMIKQTESMLHENRESVEQTDSIVHVNVEQIEVMVNENQTESKTEAKSC